MTVEEALAELEQADSDEDISYTKLAEKCWYDSYENSNTVAHVTQVSIESKLSFFERSLFLSPERNLFLYIYGLNFSSSAWPTANPIVSVSPKV